MSDKKLTDKEIVNALECCGKLHIENIDSFCNECIFKGKAMCIGYLCDNSIDLINRLQEENERLKNILICFMGALGKVRNIDDIESISQIPIMTELNKGIRAEIKAEAYKECIEKIQEEIKQALESNYKARAERIEKHNVGETDEFIPYCQGKIDCLRGLDDFLDNLLKEMQGENND